MKTFLVSVAFATGVALPAFAADVPGGLGAAPGAVEQAWSGFYAGVSVGYGRSDFDWTDVDGDWDTPGSVYGSRAEGAVGGLQAGYNVQSGNFVYGVEADISLADLSVTDNGAGSSNVTRDNGMDWFATVRGRAGFTAGPALLYVTGGLAVAEFEHQWIEDGDPDDSWPDFGETDVGFVVGGGVEAKVSQNISLKAEALYLKFEDASSTNDLDYEMVVDRDAVIARVGLNYHF